MLPLHRLESRRGRKPLVKISFHSYLSLRPCALVNTLKPAGRVVSSHGQWPLMSRQLFSRYPGVNGQGSAYCVNDLQAVCGGLALPKSVLAVDLRALSECCDQPVDGILGVDFFRSRIVQIDFTEGRLRILEKCDPNLANCEILPIRICNDAFCVPVRVAGNPAQWMRLDTGCDAALEWVISGTEKRRTGRSFGLSGVSVRHINTFVELGKQSFNAVNTGVHREQIFPGEDGLLGNGLLSKFRLTIDQPGNRVILEDPL